MVTIVVGITDGRTITAGATVVAVLIIALITVAQGAWQLALRTVIVTLTVYAVSCIYIIIVSHAYLTGSSQHFYLTSCSDMPMCTEDCYSYGNGNTNMSGCRYVIFHISW